MFGGEVTSLAGELVGGETSRWRDELFLYLVLCIFSYNYHNDFFLFSGMFHVLAFIDTL